MARYEDLGTLPGPEERIAAAADGLAAGALLAHPTTRVYGVGGPATPAADAELSRLKGRRPEGPVLRIGADVGRLRSLYPSAAWGADAARLAERFWPGPLTLVLDDGTARGLALRVEAHPLTRGVLARWSGALGSTSLNRTGHPPARTEAEAREALDALLEALPGPALRLLFLPAGDLAGPPPSTLLSLLPPGPRLLREGAIPRAEIEAALGRGVLP
jgi:L-threonylcarbamoyladenylate synthase